MRQACSFVINETHSTDVFYGSLIDGCSIRSDDEINRTTVWPETGSIENIIIWLTGAPTSGNGYTLDVLVEGLVRATVNIENAVTSAIITGPIDVVAGQKVLIKSTPIGVPVSDIAEVAWEFVSPNLSKISVYGSSPDAVDVALTDYRGGPGGIRAWTTTLTSVQTISPIDGMLTSLWASTIVSPGGAQHLAGEIAFVLNGVLQDGSGATVDTRVTIDATSEFTTTSVFVTNNIAFELPIVRGDLTAIQWTPGPGPYASGAIGVSFTFVADTDGFSIIAATPISGLTDDDVVYSPSWNPDNVPWFETEVWPRRTRANVTSFDIGLSIVRLTVAPSTGSSRQFDLRKNTADTGITITIADTDIQGEDILNGDTIDQGDTWGWQSEPTNLPDAAISLLALSQFIEPPIEPEPEPPPPAATRSGIYQMVPNKTNDTVFTDVDLFQTLVVKIPDPFIKTGPIGE